MNFFCILVTLLTFFSFSKINAQEEFLEKNFNELMCPNFSLKYKNHLRKLPSEIKKSTNTYFEEIVKRYYEIKDRQLLSEKINESFIPYSIHMIWLGPNEFPEESKANILSWIEMNPDFEFYLWTDRYRELNISEVKQIIVDKQHFSKLYEKFCESKNFSEKSDLLRYEILYNFGGIYVDHDQDCRKSVKTLCDNYDFFASLSELDAFSRWKHHKITNYKSALILTGGVLGGTKNNQIILKTINLVDSEWNKISDYCSSVLKNPLEQVILRSFLPLSITVGKELQNNKNAIIFPAQYFGMYFPDTEFNKNPIYGKQFFKSTWTKEL